MNMRSSRVAVAAALMLASATQFCMAAASDVEPVTDHPEVIGALKMIDAWIDGNRAFEDIPGVSVGIVLDQQVLWSKGYGYANVAEGIKANADTIYSICSISKLFTSIGVMQLRDEDKLALRDPIEKHLDWFNIQQVHEGSGPITIEGLLTHSSGLPRESDYHYWGAPDFPFPTHEQILRKLGEQQTLYPSQQLFQYSNLGLTLAGEIVSARSGMDYADYVSKKILVPLGMNDTRPFFPEELHGKQMAVGYSGLDRSRKRQAVEPFFTRGISPAAGFTSTVNDLMKFASWQFRLLGDGGNEVLAANTLREMHRVHWVNPDWKVTWGLGFNVTQRDDGTVVGHSGGCPGYITSIQLLPKHKLAAVTLTNASDANAVRFSGAMLKTIAGALQKTGTPPEGALPDYSAYEGNYELKPWGGETAFRQWGEHLVAIGLPSDDLSEGIVRYEHVRDHEFVRLTEEDEPRETIVFQIGDDGRAVSFIEHSMTISRVPLPDSD